MAKLFLVPTPIGNLEDITLRAIRILKEVDLILAEDTRTTAVLLKRYAITTRMSSHHKFNEHHAVEAIAQRILQGENIALVSDAGTPGISDPGFLLIRECIKHGVEVESLPGPSAFLPALLNSGLPAEPFYFEGFLPHKKGRQTRLKFLSGLPCTLIIYESPHRLVKTLENLALALGENRLASVSRELTKKFEDTRRGTIRELIQHFLNKPVRGEIVIVVEGKG
ncbi:MAG: 16S rRNA (cytidine(1402)-2'-O)-methyltransferase [Bacteroidales bacterium]|nr:16S rRNA (cytidine(1402)-2'-O)-methyltransferase [Lentimicrobiaceae bacterium]MDD5695311.1 16S rRNA (cytidine(1402)-2'-O)-methyltransferase [Bacteroidales bacterium]